MAGAIKKAGGISAETVEARTGKPWDEWFRILDEAGAKDMTHKEIVRTVASSGDVSSWWQQSIAVAYEQKRGLREKYEKTVGYEISKSRTIGAPAVDLFRAWAYAEERGSWLGDADVALRRESPPKRVALSWRGQSMVDVSFLEKGKAKTQVVVQHSRLSDGDEAARMKEYWSARLQDLEKHITKRQS